MTCENNKAIFHLIDSNADGTVNSRELRQFDMDRLNREALRLMAGGVSVPSESPVSGVNSTSTSVINRIEQLRGFLKPYAPHGVAEISNRDIALIQSKSAELRARVNELAADDSLIGGRIDRMMAGVALQSEREKLGRNYSRAKEHCR